MAAHLCLSETLNKRMPAKLSVPSPTPPCCGQTSQSSPRREPQRTTKCECAFLCAPIHLQVFSEPIYICVLQYIKCSCINIFYSKVKKGWGSYCISLLISGGAFLTTNRFYRNKTRPWSACSVGI